MPAPTSTPPTIVCLHFLGGSARSWQPMEARLRGIANCVTIDLPGFGDAASAPGETVTHMADAVADAIRSRGLDRWTVVGHSMGAKVASVVARRAEDGEGGLDGLAGLVLLAGSPPAPEPMDEEHRMAMLGWFAGDAAASRAEAQGYIDTNVTAALGTPLNDAARDDVLRANPARWRAWLQSGSREDWASRIGVLRAPALLVTGADDPLLGPDGQARLTAPHFANVRHVTLPATKHLLPLERPAAVAELIAEHAR